MIDSGILAAVRVSLEIGFWCALLGLPVAASLGWLLARKRFRGKTLVTAGLFIPLALPPVVTGYLLLLVFGGSLAFTLSGAVVAALVVGLPLYVMAARAAFEMVDPRLEEAAATLGSSPWDSWRRVTLPLALPGLAAGAVLAFARGLGEFGATIVLAGNIEGRTRSVALAVYTLLESPDGGAALKKLVVASLLMSACALWIFELLVRRQKDRLELPG